MAHEGENSIYSLEELSLISPDVFGGVLRNLAKNDPETFLRNLVENDPETFGRYLILSKSAHELENSLTPLQGYLKIASSIMSKHGEIEESPLMKATRTKVEGIVRIKDLALGKDEKESRIHMLQLAREDSGTIGRAWGLINDTLRRLAPELAEQEEDNIPQTTRELTLFAFEKIGQLSDEVLADTEKIEDLSVEEYIGMAIKAARRTRGTIRALSFFQSEHKTISPRKTHLVTMISDIFGEQVIYHNMSSETGEIQMPQIIIGEGITADTVFLVDKDLMRQVLLNLASNTIKYGGDEIGIYIAGEDGSAVFAVRDNGEGIVRGDLKRIFEPFERANGSLKDGQGLGLAVCKDIIEAHGGKIWAESEGIQGRGSTFIFTLPLPEKES